MVIATVARSRILSLILSFIVAIWDLTLRHYLSPAYTTSALLDKSVHPWMMPRLLLLRRHLFRRAWIR